MKNKGIDYTGARGSNAGDIFHELWTVREALRLLQPDDDLQSIEVEGVRSENSPDGAWEGVDCALYFGGDSLASASRINLQQLKYSSSDPAKNWTVSRIAAKDGKPKGQGSVIHRLGYAYSNAKLNRPDLPQGAIKVSLITNQPVSDELLKLIEGARSSVPKFQGKWTSGQPKLHRLVEASGLTSAEFKEFAQSFEIGSQSGSRFGLEESMLSEIAKWADTEFREIALRLQKFVRDKMLPEETGHAITRESILLQFGVSDEWGLLPCPPRLSFPTNSVPRSLVFDLFEALKAGNQRICLHGSGGVGKTTILDQLSDQLPEQSELIVYDCYGAGTYLDASALRHRPREAFIQLANELALRLRLPVLLEPKSNRDFARSFYSRLSTAASALAACAPQALLVIVIDAADNSIYAAKAQEPTQPCFVPDIISFSDLPDNVRLIISARTGRLDTLNLPHSFKPFELPPFSNKETALFVSRIWEAPAAWIEDFHHLSGGVARVQNYAFQQVGSDFSEALEHLRPNGRTLNEVFGLQFNEAVKKAGSRLHVEKICATLISLPRPIPIDVAARVLDVARAEIQDICNDLAPGVRNQDGLLGFADEDFETFVRERAEPQIKNIRGQAAKLLLAESETTQYGALHVAQLLLDAGLISDLLDLVESKPQPSDAIIPDPVRRQETYARRLLSALRACREAGDTLRALRFVLIGAEGRNTEVTTRDMLIRFPRLAARYAKESSGRMILGDPKLVEHHGPHLLQRMSVDAEAGDQVSLRETQRLISAWFDLRNQNRRELLTNHYNANAWGVSASDHASALIALVNGEGTKGVISRLNNVRSINYRSQISKLVVDRLLANQSTDLIKDAAARLPAWLSIYPYVRLASLGHQINFDRLAFGLNQLMRRWPMIKADDQNHESDSCNFPAEFINLQLEGAEVLVASGQHEATARRIFSTFVRENFRRPDKLYKGDTSKIDAILRSMSMTSLLDGAKFDGEDVLTKSLEEGEETQKGNHARERRRELEALIAALVPFYRQRAEIIAGSEDDLDREKMPAVSDAWLFDHKFEHSQYRIILADGLIILGAAKVDATKILDWVTKTAKGLRPGNNEIRASIVQKLTANPDLHAHLLSTLINEADAVVRERVGAEEKSSNLANMAESLVPLSPKDADAIFQLAVEAAAQLDHEIGDQIRLLSALTSKSAHAFGDSGPVYASQTAEVVADAGIRVGNDERFPWTSALSMIEQLDLPTALASVARWHDENIADLGDTLEAVVKSAVRANRISISQAAALLLLRKNPSSSMIKCLICAAKNQPKRGILADELARDVLGERIPDYDELNPFIRSNGCSQWAIKYVEQRDFKQRLLTTEHETVDTSSWVPNGPKWDPASVTWNRTDLIDSDSLETAAETALQSLRGIEGFGSLGSVLREARNHVNVADRVDFLEALKTLALRDGSYQLVSFVIETSEFWVSPAITTWRKSAYREMMTNCIGAFCGGLYIDPQRLAKSTELSGLAVQELQSTMLEGIERSADTLDAGAMLELAEIIADGLADAEAAELTKWYIERLHDRVLEEVPNDKLENIEQGTLPVTSNEAVAQFIAAYMSDVDLRLRWQAAHAMRRLARFQDIETVRLLIERYHAFEDPAFRTKGAPYYWLATRLWLLIACDRISDEQPDIIAPYFAFFLKIATDAKFPHLLIREYAASTCRNLIAASSVQPSEMDLGALKNANRFLPPTQTIKQQSARSEPRDERLNKRIQFNSMDTLPYWFEPWVRVFEDLSMDDFTVIAESWIIDRWGAEIEEFFESNIPTERRRHRYGPPFDRLVSKSHHDVPTVENYRAHLEWHSMWCTVGELAQTQRRASEQDDDWDDVKWRIAYGRPTHPPYWLSDFCGPPPLQSHHYRKAFESIDCWKNSISDEEFLQELLPADSPNWIVVDARGTIESQNWRHQINITSSLIRPEKASALVRALQLAPNSYDFYLPPERDDRLISSPPYELIGWLSDHDGDRLFDEIDPLNHDSDRVRRQPGTRISNQFDLIRYLDGGLVWKRGEDKANIFMFETWGRKREDAWGRPNYLGDSVISNGYRLLVRKDALSVFLDAESNELIVELEVEKRDKRGEREYYLEEDPLEAVYDRVVLLRRDGVIEAAECDLGAWKEDCS